MKTLSILIPTKDRPLAAYKAIKYSIQQSDPSTEIVVSDNSSSPFRGVLKSKLVREGLLDSVTLFEQKNVLPMHSNWEFLVNNSCGDYIAVLPDRWVPRLHAFSTIRSIIKDQSPDCIFWDTKLGIIKDNLINTSKDHESLLFVESINPYSQLQRILSFQGWTDNSCFTQPFPRSLNSVTSRALVNRIKGSVGSFFRPLSCDYTSGISVLIEGGDILYVKESLYLSFGSKSNGASNSIYGCRKHFNLTSQIESNDIYPDVDCVLSTVLHDILESLSLHGKIHYAEHINLLGYYKSLVRELEFKMWHGSLLDIDKLFSCIYKVCQANLGASAADEVFELYSNCMPKYRRLRRFLRIIHLIQPALSFKEKLINGSGFVPYSDDHSLLRSIVYS
jgi:hypothetical protein